MGELIESQMKGRGTAKSQAVLPCSCVEREFIDFDGEVIGLIGRARGPGHVDCLRNEAVDPFEAGDEIGMVEMRTFEEMEGRESELCSWSSPQSHPLHLTSLLEQARLSARGWLPVD